MKKISLIGIVTALCVTMVNPAIAISINLRTRTSEENILGQKVIRELGENVKAANLLFKSAVTEEERERALKNAHEAAKKLLDTLNDIKTYGNETIRGYTPALRRQAAITMAELLIKENSLEMEIKNKRMEKTDMTNAGFFETVKSGKSEAYAQTAKELRSLLVEVKNTHSAIESQETILETDWSNTIKLAIQNLIIGNSYGIAYDVNWHFGDRGAKLMMQAAGPREIISSPRPKRMRKEPLTDTQKAAIKSWHHLRKSELLSKEISTAYQLTQAKELLGKLNNIKEDLQNVPSKYNNVLNKVTENADSLERKIERSKTRWLK